ncbi:glycosyltransferase family 2 protein [Natrarchaeobaculum aegyptiacum]|uniref:Glycosyl transferase family 2 n=1 Tax=Natrarchaeobaculum aegyptiacum TaxID=745377 RepID=A0A2Z2HQJ9_9EURY|nr:glycosyltransferase family A protein [Natrarchaeobaculum aegyptiacum]ARS89391.1 glycosyl transferase family 2 [Natrarchaeobaculum aegyptiacum]
MALSVVISTLNDRERLLTCLDALDERTPASTEVIVVNGPSSDGTTGAVRNRDDVDVLVEISERNPNVSRNAGLEVATGEAVAFLGGEYAIDHSWYDAAERTLAGDAAVVTGPITGERPGGSNGDPRIPTRMAGRDVTQFPGSNVAFDRTVLDALDGFDEYLTTGGARDCAHRVAGLGFEVDWDAAMAVRGPIGTDGGHDGPERDDRHRGLAYRLAKNYGLYPTVVGRIVHTAVRDSAAGTRRALAGQTPPTEWLTNGLEGVSDVAAGFRDGMQARYADRSARRNPNGISARHDRAVMVYDQRQADR